MRYIAQNNLCYLFLDQKVLIVLSFIWAMTLQVISSGIDSHDTKLCGAAACAHSFQ